MARNTDFLLLAGGRAVSQFGDQMQFLALPLLVVAITGSAAQAGLVLGAQTLVSWYSASMPAPSSTSGTASAR